jgi:hypothetical protein
MIIAVAVVTGVAAGGWAVVFWAATRAQSVSGKVAAALLTMATVVYFNLPDTVAPKPGATARAHEWAGSPWDGLIMAAIELAVAVAVYRYAGRRGLIARLTRKFDRGRGDGEGHE